MKTYKATIKAVIIKTYIVEAENETEAVEEAHDVFDLHYEDEIPEKYEETVLSIEEVTNGPVCSS